MASYTKTYYSNESSTEALYQKITDYGSITSQVGPTNGNFTFPISDLKNFTITSISISAPITESKYSEKASYTVTADSYQLLSGNGGRPDSWAVSGLSINNISTIKVEIVPSQEKYRQTEFFYYYGSKITYGRATLTVTYTGEPSIRSESPTSGTYARSAAREFKWSKATPGVFSSQTLYWKYATDVNYYNINVNPALSSFTFAANLFTALTRVQWYVEAKDESGTVVRSSVSEINIGSAPTLAITNPTSSGTIRKSIANTFSWNYSSSLSLIQTAFEIGYKLSNTNTWNTISQTSENKSYTFSANAFSYGTYNLRIRVKDADGVWSSYQERTFTAGSTPSVSVTNPANNANLRRGWNQSFTWDFKDTLNTGQAKYEFAYRLSNESTWTTSTITSSATTHTLYANSLQQGTYVWRVRALNNDGVWSSYVERTFTYGALSTITLVSPEDGANIRLLASNTVSWTYTDTLNAGQKTYELGYKISSASSWTTVTGTSATSRTFSSGTFTYNTYNFRLRVQNNDNIWTSYIYFNVQIGSIPKLYQSYPVDCNIKKDIQQIFTWELSDSLNTGQKSYELGISSNNGSTWETFTENTSRQYKSFAANKFVAGNYKWRIKVTNNDGITTNYSYGDFTVIGVTAAPVITSVTQSAIPTIKWTISSQDTFEFELFQGSTRLYSSGVQKGNNIRQFTPNIMIPDGNYIIRIRAMNEYGYFTEWMTYSFVLSTVKPNAVECFIYANDDYGVNVIRSLELDQNTSVAAPSNSKTPDAIYVLRRLYGESEWNIIGKLSTANEMYQFIDNTVIKDVQYEYCLRNYKEEAGYTDSESKLIMIKHPGVLIYHNDDIVNLILSENQQFGISHAPSKQFSYSQMIGRTYPVRESSEWLTFSTSIHSCFVTYEQYAKLQKMLESNDKLWFKGKDFSYACGIDSMNIVAAHLDRGYDISLSISRINEEELALF